MRILAIDPGNERSAWLMYDTDYNVPHAFGIEDNDVILNLLIVGRATAPIDMLVIEMVACMGMAVGAEVFETVFWIGRFCQAFRGPWHRLYRREIKLHLCGNNTAKDPNVRQALIDIYGPGKDKAIGKKATPGPLYGISNDVWSALAIARTFADVKLPQLAAVG